MERITGQRTSIPITEFGELFALELRLASILRLIFLAVGIFLAVRLSGPLLATALTVLVIYALLGALMAWLPGASWLVPQVGTRLILVGVVLDLLFATWSVYVDGGYPSALFLLYALLLFKTAMLFPYLPAALFVSFLFAPAYVGACAASAGGFYFLREPDFLLRYGLLFGLAGMALYAGHISRVRQEHIRRLYHLLRARSADLERKTFVLQRTATDLSNRVVELRSLQEGIKAISSALALDDVLRLIVENASEVLDGSPCYLAFVQEGADRPTLATVAQTEGRDIRPALRSLLENTAERIVRAGAPLAPERLSTEDGEDLHLIGAPLLVDGRRIGALMATTSAGRPFASELLGLLAAFADQAAVAVKNARLYQDLALEKARSEEKSSELEAIVRGIGDGVIVADADLRLVIINPSAIRIFGLTAPVEPGRPVKECISNADLFELLEETLTSSEQMAVREIPLPPARDYQPIYQGLGTVLRRPDGDISGIVTVLRDITGQKELERMKSNFLSVISHELKTPLHSIKGFVDIILMGKTGELNAVQSDFLSTVKDQTLQLQHLINDLLEFSRLESGQIKLEPETLALSSLIAEVVEKLSPLAEQGHVSLTSTLPADFPPIEGDPVRLEQVFSNLIDNAIKFTPAGGQVTVEGEALEDGVRMRVIDTGIGIPLEERERIFDRFYQVESGSTRPYRGTGLGLTICKHIVDRHHGRIWVEGEEGEGAIFVVELPCRLPRAEDLSIDFSRLGTGARQEPHGGGERRD